MKKEKKLSQTDEKIDQNTAAEEAAGTEGPEMVAVERAKLEEASKLFEEAQKQRDDYLDMARRVQAEFDNYRKRNLSLRAEAEDDGLRAAVKEILPTLDNLERALQAAAAEEGPLKSGLEMTLRGLNDALLRLGLEGQPCKAGDPFDPELHNAVMSSEAEEGQQPGTVAEVFQRGYSLKGKVIRYAMVRVAQ
ncbi:MAG: nucleotide exchange factor GrpE [Christensenellaceae bacterium]|jgi:molecular chaperone GrpE|nr:nucleotide exchange factor GrpE [Christensenellaceae bacterium]